MTHAAQPARRPKWSGLSVGRFAGWSGLGDSFWIFVYKRTYTHTYTHTFLLNRTPLRGGGGNNKPNHSIFFSWREGGRKFLGFLAK